MWQTGSSTVSGGFPPSCTMGIYNDDSHRAAEVAIAWAQTRGSPIPGSTRSSAIGSPNFIRTGITPAQTGSE